MLVRIAQGDAYGMACEYIKFPRDQEVHDQALRFERYGRHPIHKLAPGQYTDDTQMSVAVSEVLLELNVPDPLAPDRTWNLREVADAMKLKFAEAFVRCFKRDRRDGYARHFQAFLETVKDGQDFIQRIHPDSDKNGACMRAVPLGILPTEAQVEFAAGEQAQLTHDTEGGRGSAMIVALMSHFALYSEEPLSKVPDFIRKYFCISSGGLPLWDGSPVVGPDVGMKTARAVMTLLATQSSLLDIARTTIEWGGDTDSVLAIAWGIASARMHEKLPPFFDGGLENGPYGYKFLADLGAKLMKRYP
jgi:ADP-ribosylglycohydrolase